MKKTFEKSQALGNEELGRPKVTLGSPTVSPFCINVESLERGKGFFPVRHKNDIVRRTISLCNKEVLFAFWRKIGGTFKCYVVDG